jgi:hypothetical protein
VPSSEGERDGKSGVLLRRFSKESSLSGIPVPSEGLDICSSLVKCYLHGIRRFNFLRVGRASPTASTVEQRNVKIFLLEQSPTMRRHQDLLSFNALFRLFTNAPCLRLFIKTCSFNSLLLVITFLLDF